MKLVMAFDVLNECFNLVKDWCIKIDMVHQAMYILRSKFKWLSQRVLYHGSREGWRYCFCSPT